MGYLPDYCTGIPNWYLIKQYQKAKGINEYQMKMVDVAKKVKKKGCVTQYNFYKYPIKNLSNLFYFQG